MSGAAGRPAGPPPRRRSKTETSPTDPSALRDSKHPRLDCLLCGRRWSPSRAACACTLQEAPGAGEVATPVTRGRNGATASKPRRAPWRELQLHRPIALGEGLVKACGGATEDEARWMRLAVTGRSGAASSRCMVEHETSAELRRLSAVYLFDEDNRPSEYYKGLTGCWFKDARVCHRLKPTVTRPHRRLSRRTAAQGPARARRRRRGRRSSTPTRTPERYLAEFVQMDRHAGERDLRGPHARARAASDSATASTQHAPSASSLVARERGRLCLALGREPRVDEVGIAEPARPTRCPAGASTRWRASGRGART